MNASVGVMNLDTGRRMKTGWVWEQMAHQIEELNRQIVEERQNTRREKLSVARLQRELSKAKSEAAMKETTMRELVQEREARLTVEKQLEGAIAENKTCNAQLEALQGEIARLRSTGSVDSLCDNVVESCTRLQNDLTSADGALSDAERENCNVVVSNKQQENKVGSQEDVSREKAALLERLRRLETENSALVLENENQRDMYDHCLDEVANQVVQALLMQKDLRDECLKLHGRVRDLENQNRSLRCMFDQNPFKQAVTSPSQTSPAAVQYGPHSPFSPSSSLPSRSVHAPSPSATPSPSSPSPSPAPYAPFTHPLRSKALGSQTDPTPTGSGPDSGKDPPAPLSPRRLPNSPSHQKTDRSSSPVKKLDPSKETPQRDSYQRLVRQQYQQYHHSQQHHKQQQQQRALPQEMYRQLSAPAMYETPQHTGQHPSPQQNRVPPMHSSPTPAFSTPFLPYQCDIPGVEGAGEGMGLEDYPWALNAAEMFPPPMRQSSLPGSIGRLGISDESLNGNIPLTENLASRISRMQVMGEDRGGASSPPNAPDGRNGYVLGDQYTKPFVHAPFHYAQSLLKELQEISASVKSFESLTLEPKANQQHKRKANDMQSAIQRQKLAKNLSPCASNSSSESLSSASSPRHLMDSTSSITSAESIETTLERIPPMIVAHSSPLHEYEMQWQPEYGGNKLYDSTRKDFPPDTPSPPTTDKEPAEVELQHLKYLRSRQPNFTCTAERENKVDSGSDDGGDGCVGRGKGSKAVERYQEKVLSAVASAAIGDKSQALNKSQTPILSARDKDAINEAQKSLQVSHRENVVLCGRASVLPVRDDSGQSLGIPRSKVNGGFVPVQRDIADRVDRLGKGAEEEEGLKEISESGRTVAPLVKPKLSRQTAAHSQCQNVEQQPQEGSKQTCQKTTKTPPVMSRASPLLKDGELSDSSSPIWKRKSQMEEYLSSMKKDDDEDEETKDEGCGEKDARVASFMTAPSAASKEGVAKKSPKHVSRINGEVSPRHYAGKPQSSAKGNKKTSLPGPASSTSAVTLATSKPSGESLSRSVAMMGKADAGGGEETSSLSTGGSAHDTVPLTSNDRTIHDIKPAEDTAATINVQISKHEASEQSTKDAKDELGVATVSVQGDGSGESMQQIPVRARREATESLLQKTKMQFTRGEVGRCSLGAKMSQLSKTNAVSPPSAFTSGDRPLLCRRGPLAMATTKQTVELPVLDSSPKLPGRRQLMRPPSQEITAALTDPVGQTPGEMVEFTSQSLGERASVQSMSTESLQSTNSLGSSADWDSPSKNSASKQSPSHLGNLLSSDSESEEEEVNVNFVDMWKARSTPPIKLPDWDPNKSLEEHRKRVRESLERTESASSASSEQWILNYPMPDDPQSKMDQSGSVSRQSSVASVGRQDSSNSKTGANCEEDRRILDKLLQQERAAQSRSNSSDESTAVKRQGSAEKKNCKQGSNLSLGDESIMSDFVSSIMAEVKLESRTAEGNKGQRSKDDMVKHKKPSTQISRSQSMKVSSRPVKPERKRIPSGGLVRKSEDVVTSIPKPLGNKSAVNVKKNDTASTKSSTVKDKPSGIDAKKSGLTSPRTSFMPKVLTRTPKPSADGLNTNPLRSSSGTSTASGSEKSAEKTKKSNFKYGKGKSKSESSKTKGTSSVSSAKDESVGKDSGSKSKSKIPQLIRQGLKSSPGKTDSSKKKSVPRKESGLQKRCETKSPNGDCTVSCSTSPVSNSVPTNTRPNFVVENVPFIDDSSRSPNPGSGEVQVSPPFLQEKPPVDQGKSGEVVHRPSAKLSPRLLQRLQASGIELANSSGSDNDSVFLHDDPTPTAKLREPSKAHLAESNAPANQRLELQPHCADTSALANQKEGGCSSELQLDQKEIEDIKNGLLVSNHDALSIGSWSAKSSEFGLKNTFLFGNGDFGNTGTPSSRSLGRGSLAPSMSSNAEETFEGTRSVGLEAEEEVEAKRYDVPLVSTDLMEDFEAEDLCEEDGMSSDREKEAQLSEKERANLLDSLFESDDSEDGELDGFLDESSESALIDSHPGEQEFMKLLGDKGLKRQVVRQAIYSRVSILQMDIFSLYNRFDDPEKEALACFDFLEEAYVNNAGETHFTNDHPLSVISPQTDLKGGLDFGGGLEFGGSGGIKDYSDAGLLQAGDTADSLFGENLSEITLACDSLTSKSPLIGDSLREAPSSGEFSGEFDTESYSSRHSNKVFDGCYAIGDFADHLGNRSNLCSSMSSSSTASLSSHE